MARFWLTGDTHGDFNRIIEFVEKMKTSREDIITILGDAGLNFYLNNRDIKQKELLSILPITLFCIKGNHEKYPETLPGYITKEWNGGIVFYEEKYPNILFAKDGEVYNINGNKCLVIGGAYSVDKYYRLSRGWTWFDDEQPSDEVKEKVEKLIGTDNKYDYILSHTCPYSARPVHLFLPQVDQSTVDNSTEIWLEDISNKIEFKNWYFGHYHSDWTFGKYKMLFNGFDEIV